MFNIGIDVSGYQKEIEKEWKKQSEEGLVIAEAWLRQSLPTNAIRAHKVSRGATPLESISDVTFSEEFITQWVDPQNIKERLKVYEMFSKVVSEYITDGKKPQSLRFFIKDGLLKAEVIGSKGMIINAKKLDWYKPEDLIGLLLVKKMLDDDGVIKQEEKQIKEMKDTNKDGLSNNEDGKVKDFSGYHSEIFQSNNYDAQRLRTQMIELGQERIPIPRLYYEAQVTLESLHAAIWEAANNGWLMFETIPYNSNLDKQTMALTIPTDDDSYVFYVSYALGTNKTQPKEV